MTAFLFAGLFASQQIFAQTTEFNYQGSLKNGGILANGNYDFEFALYDSLSGGAQVGATRPSRLTTTATANPTSPFSERTARTARNGGYSVQQPDCSLCSSERQLIKRCKAITLATAKRTSRFSDLRRDSGLFFARKTSHSSRFRSDKRAIFRHRETLTATASLTRPFSDRRVRPGIRKEQLPEH